MHSEIAVIGDGPSILGFRAVGFQVYEAGEDTDIVSLVSRLASENYGVIFITEQALAGSEAILDMFNDKSIPAIIPIPGRQGVTGAGMRNLSKSVERAMGADILFK